jgi:hypothetical protein
VTFRHRGLLRKDCFGETPKPARETRALPGNRSERYMRSSVFFPITLRIIIDDATLVDCRGVDLHGLSSGADSSC